MYVRYLYLMTLCYDPISITVTVTVTPIPIHLISQNTAMAKMQSPDLPPPYSHIRSAPDQIEPVSVPTVTEQPSTEAPMTYRSGQGQDRHDVEALCHFEGCRYESCQSHGCKFSCCTKGYTRALTITASAVAVAAVVMIGVLVTGFLRNNF